MIPEVSKAHVWVTFLLSLSILGGAWVALTLVVLLCHDEGTHTSNTRRLKAPGTSHNSYGIMSVCKEGNMISHLPKIFYTHNP